LYGYYNIGNNCTTEVLDGGIGASCLKIWSWTT
jgi:hypothetical protein